MNTAESAIWEGRARIMWGESPEEVSAWMQSQGVEAQRADDVIQLALQERSAEARRRGMIQLFMGIGIVAVCGGVLYFLVVGYGALSKTTGAGSRGPGALAGVLFLGVLYGLWQLIDGIMLLVRGGRAKGSVASMGFEEPG
ncbi:MAG TPA: hypothetical protein VEJ63_01735 [Planctomycetota bacterium]|nr:hypothetical protein [Planctomycetota bacterium]